MSRANPRLPKKSQRPPAIELRVGAVPKEIPRTNPNLPDRALSDVQRRRLENIRAGENMKKKRERLCSVLIQKLVVKYGHSNELVITALVDQFVEEKAQIKPEDLAKLEKEVVLSLRARAQSKGKSNDASDFGGPSSTSASASTSSNAVSSTKPLSVSNSKQTISESKTDIDIDPSLLKPPPAGSEWKVIAAYQELVSEEKNRAEQELARKKKTDFKKALDDHISNAQEYKKKHLDSSDKAYNEHIRKDIEKFHSEEALKRNKLHEKAHKQLLIQKQQIIDAKLRHEKEMAALANFEHDMLDNAKMKILEEEEKVARRRQHAKAQQLIVDADNEANQKIKDAQALKDADEDQRLMKEYAAKMDKDESDRANAFAERMKKMEAFNAKFENDGAGKAIKDERIKMELLLLKEQADAEAKAVAKEHAKAQAKRERLQRMMHENEKLVEAKQKKNQALREEDVGYANRALNDVAKFKREEQEKRDRLHQKHLKYRDVLDVQMKNKAPQADPTSAAFIGRESLVNRSLYEKAVHDPNVLKKLNSPVKPQQKGPRIATHK